MHFNIHLQIYRVAHPCKWLQVTRRDSASYEAGLLRHEFFSNVRIPDGLDPSQLLDCD